MEKNQTTSQRLVSQFKLLT